MAQEEFRSVDEYISSQPEGAQQVLGQVRSAILRTVPAAEEVISYGIPAYKLQGARLLSFAGWKGHYALYGATARLVEAFRGELDSYEISKGTIRFPFADTVPVTLIERIAAYRAKELER